MVLRRSYLQSQCLTSLVRYGAKFSKGLLVSIIANNMALVEMSYCGCRKECQSNKRKFFKDDLVCTDLCKSTKEKNKRKNVLYRIK